MEMTSMNISLPEAMKEYIEAKVAAGGYGTASEYIRELVRAAQKREAEDKLEALLLEGINSGPATPMTEADWEEHRQKLREHIARRQRQRA
jgi:antitoxin ParD1/3/4